MIRLSAAPARWQSATRPSSSATISRRSRDRDPGSTERGVDEVVGRAAPAGGVRVKERPGRRDAETTRGMAGTGPRRMSSIRSPASSPICVIRPARGPAEPRRSRRRPGFIAGGQPGVGFALRACTDLGARLAEAADVLAQLLDAGPPLGAEVARARSRCDPGRTVRPRISKAFRDFRPDPVGDAAQAAADGLQRFVRILHDIRTLPSLPVDLLSNEPPAEPPSDGRHAAAVPLPTAVMVPVLLRVGDGCPQSCRAGTNVHDRGRRTDLAMR